MSGVDPRHLRSNQTNLISTMKRFQFIPLAVLLTGLLFFFMPNSSAAQGNQNRGNAHIMDISLQFDTDVNAVACLGEPSELTVKPGDVVVFRAVGTFVNHVRWADDTPGQQAALNAGKPNLSSDKDRGQELKGTGMFDRGQAFAVRINDSIESKTTYDLVVKCGRTDDAPPKIIVDP